MDKVLKKNELKLFLEFINSNGNVIYYARKKKPVCTFPLKRKLKQMIKESK